MSKRFLEIPLFYNDGKSPGRFNMIILKIQLFCLLSVVQFNSAFGVISTHKFYFHTEMKKVFQNLRDIFVAGLIFLLPLVVVIVLLSKVFKLLTGFATKIAALFGLESIGGISGGTIVSAFGIILICIVCGYLVRISFFKSARDWVDQKLMAHIPGYAVYREMALTKLEEREEALPYESAAWVSIDNVQQPAFLMERMSDGKMIVFIPTAGNVKEGTLLKLPASSVELCPDKDMKAFRIAIENLGIGMSKV